MNSFRRYIKLQKIGARSYILLILLLDWQERREGGKMPDFEFKSFSLRVRLGPIIHNLEAYDENN